MEVNPDTGLLLVIEIVFIVISLIIGGLLGAADTAMTMVNRNQIRCLPTKGTAGRSDW